MTWKYAGRKERKTFFFFHFRRCRTFFSVLYKETCVLLLIFFWLAFLLFLRVFFSFLLLNSCDCDDDEWLKSGGRGLVNYIAIRFCYIFSFLFFLPFYCFDICVCCRTRKLPCTFFQVTRREKERQPFFILTGELCNNNNNNTTFSFVSFHFTYVSLMHACIRSS